MIVKRSIWIPFLAALLLLMSFQSQDLLSDSSILFPDQASSPYVLPYPVGKAYICSQGYDRRSTHAGQEFFYAVDFAMAIGTPITAARNGTVLAVVDHFGDEEYGFTTHSNYVIVDHSDGSFGRYVHLTRNGASVKQGQIVSAGDLIGHSGSSGSPGHPHLHFDVTQGNSLPSAQTVPVCFRNTIGHPNGLQSGVRYPAVLY